MLYSLRQEGIQMREMFEKHFAEIEDTRCQCDIDYKLVDVLIQIMCAVICGLDELDEIVTYGKEKIAFLSEYFEIRKTPSKSTLTRTMNMINGEAVAKIIINIMLELLGSEGEIVAIDGKTICSTAKKNSAREKLHILSAYVTKNGVTLGQLAVNEKTNEIPVMRDLLDMIDVKGKIITADAMHCQKATVEKIIELEGDYVIGLKGNQETLFEEVKEYIEDCVTDKTIEIEKAQTVEKNRGRFEKRTCFIAPDLSWCESLSEWVGLKTAFAVLRETTTKDGRTEEMSFYISSRLESPERFLEITREHWGIESMHWQLDVVFSEDECRIFSSNGQKSMNIFRKLALALHKNYTSNLEQKTKPSLKKNMLKALLSDSLLVDVIQNAL